MYCNYHRYQNRYIL